MLLNLRQLGVRENDGSELEMVTFGCSRLFRSLGGNTSSKNSEVVFNYNHTRFPEETFTGVAY